MKNIAYQFKNSGGNIEAITDILGQITNEMLATQMPARNSDLQVIYIAVRMMAETIKGTLTEEERVAANSFFVTMMRCCSLGTVAIPIPEKEETEHD